MALSIITADERLANAKTTVAIFGPAGAGKTSLVRSLPPAETIVIDLDAGMKSLQGWGGDPIPVPSFQSAKLVGVIEQRPDSAVAERAHAFVDR